MSHQPPDIIDTEVDPSTWAVTVKWQVDPILHGEVPDTVDIEVDGGSLKTGLPGSTTEYTIDGALAHNLPGPELGITVDFVWSEDMNPQQSSVLLQWPPQASTQPPQGDPPIPTVNVNGTSPKTLNQPNAISVHWASWSFNDGKIEWGRHGQSLSRTHNIKPRRVPNDYSGNFTTDVPLQPNQLYDFKVTVVNSLKTNVPVSKTTAVASSSNFRSLGDFLEASGVDKYLGTRAAVAVPTGSLSVRELLEP